MFFEPRQAPRLNVAKGGVAPTPLQLLPGPLICFLARPTLPTALPHPRLASTASLSLPCCACHPRDVLLRRALVDLRGVRQPADICANLTGLLRPLHSPSFPRHAIIDFVRHDCLNTSTPQAKYPSHAHLSRPRHAGRALANVVSAPQT